MIFEESCFIRLRESYSLAVGLQIFLARKGEYKIERSVLC